MAILEIPIRSDIPSYSFKIDLDDVTYTMEIFFNLRMCRWHFNLLADNEDPLVMGIPIHINVDLVGRFKQTNKSIPQGIFFAVNSVDANAEPTRDNFSTDVKLLYNEAT